ncbi:hypothetical protein [Phenylobacterium sp.]|uniref:hypothetical protein n=1 Tax=Phenylobacterium sp. TaxID=1871053 RepID=UPI002FCA2840
MATFSIGEAVGSGFALIRREPLAVLVWGLAYFVVGVLPQIAMFALIFPDFIAMARESATSGSTDAATPAQLQQLLGMQAKMMLMQLVQFATSILAAVLLYGAVLRAVLEPENRAFWYLRVGPQEGWLAAVLAVGVVLLMMAAFVVMIPFMIVGVLLGLAGANTTPVEWLAFALFAIGGMGVFWWAALRLSLSMPMTFAERKFMLFESWPLTKGHAWPMFLTSLALVGLILMIEVVLAIVFVMVAVAAVLGMGVDLLTLETPDKLFANPPENWLMIAVIVGVAVFGAGSFLTAALHAIMLAPYATIYRRLASPALTAPGT